MQHKLSYKGKYPLKIEHNVTVFKQFKAMNLPLSADLRKFCPAIYNQLQLGSCTANALVAAYQYLDLSYYGSRLFLYYNERVLDHDVNVDAGSTLTQGINALQRFGVCSESSWIYSDNAVKYKTKPPQICYTTALDHQVIAANAISQDLASMKQCLANGFPFVGGIMVYQSFESDTVATSGVVPMPQPNEMFLGGHAVMCVGYDDTRSVFIMRNSWGTEWGDKGYFYLPYNYLTNANLAGDFWEITKVEIPAPPKPKPQPKPKPNPPKKRRNRMVAMNRSSRNHSAKPAPKLAPKLAPKHNSKPAPKHNSKPAPKPAPKHNSKPAPKHNSKPMPKNNIKINQKSAQTQRKQKGRIMTIRELKMCQQ